MARHAQETGFTASGPINMGSSKISSLAAGTSTNDAINKGQLDAAVPIGTIIMFAGSTGFDTSMWHLCDGSAHGSSALQSVIGSTTTPDLRSRFVVGAGQGTGLTSRTLAATGGAESVTLTTTQIPGHTHTGTTNTSGAPHTHSVSATTSSAGDHGHTGTAVNAEVPHQHTMSFMTDWENNHTHGINGGNHTHGLVVQSNTSTSGTGRRITGGAGAIGDATADAGHSHGMDGAGGHDHLVSGNTNGIVTGQTTSHGHTLSIVNNGAHTHTISTTSGAASATDHTHGFTTASTGGGGSHENMPPFYVLTFLIRKA